MFGIGFHRLGLAESLETDAKQAKATTPTGPNPTPHLLAVAARVGPTGPLGWLPTAARCPARLGPAMGHPGAPDQFHISMNTKEIYNMNIAILQLTPTSCHHISIKEKSYAEG